MERAKVHTPSPDSIGPRPSLAPLPEWRVPILTAARRALAKGYHFADFRADALAGLIVGVVALPLSMALSIAVGLPPQHGLYTAVIAGAAVAILGGCKFQVTGPTAAFVVVLAPIATKHGLSGLLTAGFLAGLLLIAMGVARLGSLIQYVPSPVTTGFTTGIATVIATLQLKDVLGLTTRPLPDHFIEKLGTFWAARGTARWEDAVVATVTLLLLVYLPRLLKNVPAPLAALALVSAVAATLHHFLPAFSVATIGTRFQTVVDGVTIAGIPPTPPALRLPWAGQGLSFADVRELTTAAFAIAVLAAIESLLSAVIADGMTNTRHDPNAELVGLGIGNVLAPFFGGIAATGALARTATNIRAGARTPVAAVVHSLVVLLAILLLAPLVAYVPMACLAALLLRVAWNMSEAHHFLYMLKVAPKSDVAVLTVCYLLTVVFDMIVAVSVGFMLAAILFMRRMADLTEGRLKMSSVVDGGEGADDDRPLPPGVVVYEINGPLFFGAAQRAMGTLGSGPSHTFHTLVLSLGRVPVVDATGLVALEGAITRIQGQGKRVFIAGPLPRPAEIFDRARLERRHPGLVMSPTLDAALAAAADPILPGTPGAAAPATV